MRLLIDSNLPPKLAHKLVDLGHDAIHVSDVFPGETEDFARELDLSPNILYPSCGLIRYRKDGGLSRPELVDELGNKVLLEQRINIRASDYRFPDKKKYYLGFTDSNGVKYDASMITELKNISANTDFAEAEILDRGKTIRAALLSFLAREDLLIPKPTS